MPEPAAQSPVAPSKTVGFDNRISLQKLEIFCLVVELGGVSRAAERLFVSQPVVTAHLRSFQDRLGATLLYRDGQRMRLTEAGERAYQWASDTLSRTNELARELGGITSGARGSIVVAAYMSLGTWILPPIVTDFRQQRPHADITLHVGRPEEAAVAVQAGEVDFAFVMGDTPPEPPLVGELIGYEDVVVVAAPGVAPPEISVADLATLPIVSAPHGFQPWTLLDRRLRERNVSLRNVIIELGHPEALRSAAKRGSGATFLFRTVVADDLAEGSLVETRLTDIALSVPVYAIVRMNKRLSPIQQALRDEIVARLTPQLLAAPPADPV